MIRILVIDDSAFMRKALSLMISSDPEMEVIGTAQDGKDGYEKTLALKPDLVTLDIEMPGTDGLSYIQMIMAEQPTPILVVSSLTTKGAEITLKALSLGAMDYIPKSQSLISIDISKIEAELKAKIKAIAHGKPGLDTNVDSGVKPSSSTHDGLFDDDVYDLSQLDVKCIAIGVSTGGPPVLQRLLSALPESFPVPILIAQHMPEEFTTTFARRLNTKSDLTVKEAEHGEVIRGGHAYIGRGGQHISIGGQPHRARIRTGREPADLLYHPSADVLFGSVAKVFDCRGLGLILTGMGKDGVLGLQEMKASGASILAQNADSCAVYGMPRAAVEAGVVAQEMTVDGLAQSLKTLYLPEGAFNE